MSFLFSTVWGGGYDGWTDPKEAMKLAVALNEVIACKMDNWFPAVNMSAHH